MSYSMKTVLLFGTFGIRSVVFVLKIKITWLFISKNSWTKKCKYFLLAKSAAENMKTDAN